jgi:putative tricarboxylic transport membrane protein
VLQRLRIPLAPIVLGLVLGPTLEQQYRTALILSEGRYATFIESTFAVCVFALIVVLIAWQLWSALGRRTTAQGEAQGEAT